MIIFGPNSIRTPTRILEPSAGLNFFQQQDVNESVWLSMEKPGQSLALSDWDSQSSDDHPVGLCFLIGFLALSEIFGWIDGRGERSRRFLMDVQPNTLNKCSHELGNDDNGVVCMVTGS